MNRPWRAPTDDGAVLCDPPPDQFGSLLDHNRRLFAAAGGIEIGGLSLAELRRLARAELGLTGDVLLAGHQPELFHPGVWLKNFALHHLGRRFGLTPVNLVVDSDAVKSTSLRLPVLDPDPAAVRLVDVPFDTPPAGEPFEDRPVRDEGLFRSLPDRVAPLVAGWGFEPILREVWAATTAGASPAVLLGDRLMAGRRAIEHRWGCHNIEVPLSTVCGTAAFGRFFGHVLTRLPEFHAAYNDAVRAYRRAWRVRSRNHPVPDLAADGDWREAPFWAWQPGERQRQRLFVRAVGENLEIRAGEKRAVVRSGSGIRIHHQVVCAGWAVRTRALTTTLFARVALGEALVHGIGGGLYDRLTDDLIRRWFGQEPPRYAVVSGTLRLPLPRFPSDAAQVRELAHRLRDLYWNPQRYVPDETAVAPVVRRRWELSAAEPQSRAGRRDRRRELRRLTELLRPHTKPSVAVLRPRLGRSEAERAANTILGRRDFAFVLYPEADLRRFLDGTFSRNWG